MKPRFIHFQAIAPGDPKRLGYEWVRYRGFTAYLSTGDEGELRVRLSYCSIGDAFCKAQARAAVMLKLPVKVEVKDLPKVLAEAQHMCYSRTLGKEDKILLRHRTNKWAWVWKYFL